MRLTKKKLRALDMALSMDDVLHAKFLQLHAQLGKEIARFGRMKCIASIRQKHNGLLYQLQIENIEVTPNGLVVYVQGAKI